MKEDLLTSVYRRCKERLRLTARRYVGDDEADDALQEAFCRLWKRKDDLISDSEAEGLTVTVLRNVCIDTLRRQAVRRHDTIDEGRALDVAADDPQRNEDLADLYSEVSTLIDGALSVRDRRVLYLRDRDGWEFEDIAAETGLSEANIRLIVSRARKTIRQLYVKRHQNTL